MILPINLERSQTALLIIDMQDKIFATVDHGAEVLKAIFKTIKGFQALQIPIFISEQYPQGLGETLMDLKSLLRDQYSPWVKTTFSCLDDPIIKKYIEKSYIQQWVIVGLEAHICILQTAKGLLQAGKQVIVLNDAIASRSIYNFSIAIAEMRDLGIRISSSETILFELLKDSKQPEFKSISQMIKSCEC
ncbi:isochorismatase family protein [Candidatus Protochlamydia sp. R18]|uniref:isochorismatase family protein n=1 Tax=Candidatus Protochlamydia sp. R18 TaxID=1353977 RepID=UPI0005A856AE|nr:isochorismatase family protein [Candidatus Protochlamydia sp. R18]